MDKVMKVIATWAKVQHRYYGAHLDDLAKQLSMGHGRLQELFTELGYDYTDGARRYEEERIAKRDALILKEYASKCAPQIGDELGIYASTVQAVVKASGSKLRNKKDENLIAKAWLDSEMVRAGTSRCVLCTVIDELNEYGLCAGCVADLNKIIINLERKAAQAAARTQRVAAYAQ